MPLGRIQLMSRDTVEYGLAFLYGLLPFIIILLLVAIATRLFKK